MQDNSILSKIMMFVCAGCDADAVAARMTQVIRELWPLVHGVTLDRDTLCNRKFAPYKVGK